MDAAAAIVFLRSVLARVRLLRANLDARRPTG
jgi:hypothetical protein